MLIAHCKAAARRALSWAAVAVLLAPGAAAAESLVGRVWAPAEERFVPPEAVHAAVAGARFVLLGETHTNARHHELQARLIEAATEGGRRPPVVLEMVRQDQQDAIDEWRRAGADPGVLGAAVTWSERGWPDWSIYEPIARVALRRELALHGGAPGQETLRTVAREGAEALRPAARPRAFDRPLPEPAERQLLETLERAHCGLSDHAPVERMLAVQRLRDAAMADVLLRVDEGDGAILIAGHGHTREDHGVPHYLAGHADAAAVLSLAFMAAGDGSTLERQRELAGGSLPFDYVWFTSGVPATIECPRDEAQGASTAGG
jgi:uncharacterized iron-regulated protein